MTEIVSRRDRLPAMPQPPVEGDDHGHARDDPRRLVRFERERPGGHAQRVHRRHLASCALAEQCERRLREAPNAGERIAECLQLRRSRQAAVPQQPGGFLERGVRGQLVHRVSGDDQLAALAVDVTEPRSGRDDAFQSIACHGPNVAVHV